MLGKLADWQLPGACCGMGASTTLDEAQILESGFALADAVRRSCCGLRRRPRRAQILQSRLMLADAAQACGLAAASLAKILNLTLTLANAAQACRLAAALRARRLVDRPRRASDPRVALHDR